VTTRWLLLICSPFARLFAVLVANADGPATTWRQCATCAAARRAASCRDPKGAAGRRRRVGKEIDGLKVAWKESRPLLELLPDVQIYHNSVRYALTYSEI